jgi:hypothetical protein
MFHNTGYAREDLDWREIKLHVELEGRVIGVSYFVDCVWNVMAHAQKSDFVFRRNGRVHLNRRGRQFSRLRAAEVCASAVVMVVMLDTPCSEVVWRVLGYPLHSPVFPSLPLPCVTVCHHISTGLYNSHVGEASKVTFCTLKDRVSVLGEGRILSIDRHKQFRSGTDSSQINRRHIKLTAHRHLFIAFLQYLWAVFSPFFLRAKMSCLAEGEDSILPSWLQTFAVFWMSYAFF